MRFHGIPLLIFKWNVKGDNIYVTWLLEYCEIVLFGHYYCYFLIVLTAISTLSYEYSHVKKHRVCLHFVIVCRFRHMLMILKNTPADKGKQEYENIWKSSSIQKHKFNYSHLYVLEHRDFSLPIDSTNFILSIEHKWLHRNMCSIQ